MQMQITIENLKGLLQTIKNVRADLAEGQISIADFQLCVIENSLENYIEKEEDKQ